MHFVDDLLVEAFDAAGLEDEGGVVGYFSHVRGFLLRFLGFGVFTPKEALYSFLANWRGCW